jgi:4-aminobutyrate aminotransferase/4-aminobutyrate aminotransferase/(S)-3-amino-2-methylpropionate transaminase
MNALDKHDLTSTLLARRDRALPRGVGQAHPLFAKRARNAELWDVDGRRYIDFVGGIAVVNTGHCHADVVAAVERQMGHFTHTCFQVVAYESYVELAERLNRLFPGAVPAKSFCMSTGAEAVENAIKIARAHTRRSGIIAFDGGFHGRTLTTLALTGKIDPYKTGFGPFAPEVFHAPYPCALHGVGSEDALAGIQRIFKHDIEPDRVACIIIEPVQGEGGYYAAPPEFLVALRELCDKHGILLIADEVQTGIGRTGKMFAVEHAGVVPDIVTLAKGLGGGFPISAIVGRAEVMDGAMPGGLGGTYAGSPLGCAAALAVLDVIEKEGLLERAVVIGEIMQQHFMELARKNRTIGDVRGLGAMVAVEFLHEGNPPSPAPEVAKALIVEARQRGLLLLGCGGCGNIVRVMAPLSIEDGILAEGLEIFSQALGALA